MRIESEIGAIAAAPIPCTTRKTISHPMVGARPQASEKRAKRARPATKTIFWPNLSAMRPMERKSAAIARL